MAHADYNCCAICDRKLDYMGLNARKKEDICPNCLEGLHKIGIQVFTVDDLKEFIEKANLGVLLVAFAYLGFRHCYYWNEIDDLLMERGVMFDKNRYLVLPDNLEEVRDE